MLLEFLIIIVLVFVNGLFAMAEIAVVSSRRIRLQNEAQQGDAEAEAALELFDRPGSFLSTVQVGITVISIFAGVYGGATIVDRFELIFRSLLEIGQTVWHCELRIGSSCLNPSLACDAASSAADAAIAAATL